MDLVVTDPPYLIDYKTNHRKDKDHRFTKSIEGDSDPDMVKAVIEECYRVLKPNSAAYVFCSPDTLGWFRGVCEGVGFNCKNVIVWVKNNWTAGDLDAAYGKQWEAILYLNKGRRSINGTRHPDVWFYNRVVGENQLHQNQKPLDLIIRMVEASSDKGNWVLDPFAGSGTTLVASKLRGRHYIGCEIDEGYYKVASDRLASTQSTTLDAWAGGDNNGA